MVGSICWAAVLIGIAAGDVSDEVTVTNRLDEILIQSWQSQNIQPAPLVDDTAFVRRLWLDVCGRIPPMRLAEKQIADDKSVDRKTLIAALLDSHDAANHWSRMWTEYLLDARPFEQPTYNGRLVQRFLFQSFKSNESWGQIAAELITATGSSETSGPANFLLRYDANPTMLAAGVSKKFLGCTLQCAECHDHPHTSWKQQDFQGLSAFFARLRKLNPVEEPEGDVFTIVWERSHGELRIPIPSLPANPDGSRPQKTVYPVVPGGKSLAMSDNRRQELASWLTSEENPFFARHAVNQTWERLFGTALVVSLDDIALPNAAASVDIDRKILDLLAQDFASHGHDVKRMLRVILQSELYQHGAGEPGDASIASSNASQLEAKRIQSLASFPIRPLSADQLYLSIAQATSFRGDDQSVRLGEGSDEDFVTDLPANYFGSQPLSIVRSVALLNGEYVRGAADTAAAAARRLYGERAGVRHLRWLFLSILSRAPSADELKLLLELAGGQDTGLSDVAWTLLNSAEFNTNH